MQTEMNASQLRAAGIREKIAELAGLIDETAKLIIDTPKAESTPFEAKLALLQDEITFWKSKLPKRQREAPASVKDQTWIVRFPLSERALQIANGYTDLADIASHPHDMDSTMQEIALAVMIAVQHDGVQVGEGPNNQNIIDQFNIDERLVKRKELLEEGNFFRLEAIKAVARYERLLQRVQDIALGHTNADETLRHEQQFSAMTHNPKIEELRPSINAWKAAFPN